MSGSTPSVAPAAVRDSTTALATAISAHAGNATLLRQARPGRARSVHAIATFATSQPATAAAIAMSVPHRAWTRRNVGRTAAVSADGRERDGGQLRVVEEPARRIARGMVHRARRRRLGDEGDRRADVHEQLQDDDVDRVERGGQPQHQRHGDDHDERDLGAEVERDRAPELGGEAATALDGADDRRVGVVDEHEVGRLAGQIGPARAHRDADVRRGEGGRVVDAVAGDGDGLPSVLEDPDEPQLVLGRGAGDDGLAAQPLGELVVVERVERRAAVHDLGSCGSRPRGRSRRPSRGGRR